MNILDNGESVTRVFVCGGGHQGLSMAAHLSLNGINVTLWNRTEKNIEKVIHEKKIHCDGVVRGIATIEKASSDIKEVISDFVMVTTPSTAHKEIAHRLATFVHKNMVVVLNPGRTFGAISFAKELKRCGVKELPHIAETQTIVYTCRKKCDNSVNILALKKGVKIAAINGDDINYIMKKMPLCLKEYFVAEQSVGYTSFSNVGMVLHCAPMLMNIGWIESENLDFKYYYDGISRSVADFIQKIDSERIAVADAAGYKVESTAEWIRRTYRVEGSDIYECIRNNTYYKEIDAPVSIESRYLLEDVPNGLVPIEFLGMELNVETPNISIVIDLAEAVLGRKFRAEGRKVSLKEMMALQ